MAKRERIEDLGRIQELSNRLLDNELFDMYIGRTKELIPWWNSYSESEKTDIVYVMISHIQDVEEKIGEIFYVACGEDEDE